MRNDEKRELAELVAAGLTENVKGYLQLQDFNIDTQLDANGNTALHYANTYDMVKLLVNVGHADLFTPNKFGRTPIEVFFQQQNFSLITALEKDLAATKYKDYIPNLRKKYSAQYTYQEVTLESEISELRAMEISNMLKTTLADVMPMTSEFTVNPADPSESRFEIVLSALAEDRNTINAIAKHLSTVGVKTQPTTPVEGAIALKIDISSIPASLEAKHLLTAVTNPILTKTSQILDKELIHQRNLTSAEKRVDASKILEWGKAGRFAKNKFKLQPNDQNLGFLRYTLTVMAHKNPELIQDIRLIYSCMMKGSLTKDGTIRAFQELLPKAGMDMEDMEKKFLEYLELDLKRQIKAPKQQKPSKQPKARKLPATKSTQRGKATSIQRGSKSVSRGRS
jgi:hypothetical protein